MSDKTYTFRIDRTGKFNPDYSTQVSQSVSSALSTVAPGTTFIARAVDDHSIERYFVSTGSNSADRSFQIAQAFMSKTSPAESLELQTTNVARLQFTKESFVTSSTQAGTTLTAVAEAVDAFLTPGEWIAVSIRKASAKERKRWNLWHEHHRPGAVSVHSRRSDAVIVSIYAGSYDPGRAQNAVEQFVASLGGFEVSSQAVLLDEKQERRPMKIAAAIAGLVFGAATAARIFSEQVTAVLGEDAMKYMPHIQWGSAGLLTLMFVMSVLHTYGYLPSRTRKTKRQLESGIAPIPPTRISAPKRPRRERTETKVVDGSATLVHHDAEDGDYPLDTTTFMVGSELACAILLPGQGAKSGVSSTRSRDVPAALIRAQGPEIGLAGDQSVRLSSADFWGGLFAVGKPGSGKTQLLEWLWAWKQAHLQPLPNVGPLAYNGAMIAFDTKGDGELSSSLTRWSERTGVKTHVVKLASATPLKLNVFDASGTMRQQSERILDALSYLIGEAAGPRFRETSGVVLPLAMMVDDRVTHGADWLPSGASKFTYAHILTGSMGFDRAKELYLLIRERHGATAEVEAGVNLFGDRVTDSQFKNLVESTRNKLDSLVYTESFWRAGQSEGAAGWPWLLRNGQSVVFDFAGLSERAVSDIAQLLMFTLKSAIETHCQGFQQQGRSVTLLADEASVIAEHSPEIIEWLRAKGRSFGTEMMFATQQPAQLRTEVRRSLLGYATKIVFGQSDSATLRELATELSTGGDDWAEEDIKNLPQYGAIVSTEVHSVAQPNFTVNISDFTDRDPKAA